MGITDDIIRAHGIIGPSNSALWQALIKDFGIDAVLDECEAIWMDSGRPVSSADVRSALEKRHAPRSDADDDDDQVELPRASAPSPSPAAVDMDVDEVGASTDGHTAPAMARSETPPPATSIVQVPTPTADTVPQESIMPLSLPKKDVLALVARVDAEITRRKLRLGDAMRELGAGYVAIYSWRKGRLSADTAAKIEKWLETSTAKDKAPVTDAVSPVVGESASPPKATGKRPKQEATATADGLTLVQALARGDELVDHLTAIGATEAVVTIRALTGRLRQVSQAVLV